MVYTKGTGPVDIGSWTAPTKRKRAYARGGVVERELNPQTNSMGGVTPADEPDISRFGTPMSKDMEEEMRRLQPKSGPIPSPDKESE